MTVSYVIPSSNTFNGDGATTVFNFTFQVLNYTTDLFVYFIVSQNPTLQTTGYTVTYNTPNSLPSTGYVTFATAPPSGTTIRITRNTYEQRTTNYVAGPIQPYTLNADIDNTVLMIQDIDSQLIPQDGAGNWNLGGALLRNVGTPSAAGDAATKSYVDSIAAGTQPISSLLLQGTNTLTQSLSFLNYANGQIIFDSTSYVPTNQNAAGVVFTNRNVYNNSTSPYGAGNVLFDYSGAVDSNQIHLEILTNVSNTSIGNTAFIEMQNTAGGEGGVTTNPNFVPTSPIGGSIEITAVNYSVGALNTVTITAGGTGYVQGTYTNVPLTTTTGHGLGAQATIVVSVSGVVTSVTVNGSPTGGGTSFESGGSGANYALSDTLSASNTYLGNSGSGLVLTVLYVTSYNGKMKHGVQSAVQGGYSYTSSGYNYMSNRRGALSSIGANTGFEQQFRLYPLDLLGVGTIQSDGNQLIVQPIYNFAQAGGITYYNSYTAGTIECVGTGSSTIVSKALTGTSTIVSETIDGTSGAYLAAESNFGNPGTGVAAINLFTDNSSGNSGWQIYTTGQTGATAGTLNIQKVNAGTYSSVISLATGSLTVKGVTSSNTGYVTTGTNSPNISVGVNDASNALVIYDGKNSVTLMTLDANNAGTSIGASTSVTGNVTASGYLVAQGGTPTGALTGVAFGTTTGVGNGSSTNLTALAKSTGSGPTSDVAAGWLKINIGGTTAWIPYFE